jgi:hypothetical protein
LVHEAARRLGARIARKEQQTDPILLRVPLDAGERARRTFDGALIAVRTPAP